MKISTAITVLAAAPMCVLGAPSAPNHHHTPEQKAQVHKWKLKGYDVTTDKTAVLTSTGWYYHNGTFGGEIVPVTDGNFDEDVGYIANMNAEQPIGVFNTAEDELVEKRTKIVEVCCSVTICGKVRIDIYV
ncbi:hypothetical protein DICA2_C09538 [Diutina catenulata]